MLRKVNNLYLGLAKPEANSSDSSGTSEVTKSEFIALSEQVTQNENDITTLQNDRDDLGDQVQAIQADVNALKDGVGGVVVGEKYGIRADYAIHHGILDCPNGLIQYNMNNKEIEIQPGVVLQAAGNTMKTTIASATKYEVEETGKVTLFFTRTESESGTIQVGFLEAGDVFYQEEEPEDGVTSFLAWWKPSLGKWQFKSSYTGNVWRSAVATPLADINASSTGIVSVSYVGYRIINDDIFAQLEDIESIQNQIAGILERLDTLEGKV